ncbi:hypothetical protein DYB25_013705 [Aphanomyces astaci]|uniref:Uncharacterized protein n=1 Tax=Aphanomyces astaci TaxID=112090 RepID=A0A397AQE2_APHAT|nr:hypothetical protein DYB25_013705 [Aphanomyces astaci]
MSLPPTSSSRAALPITHRLVGAEDYDDWFLELTSIILPGEALDSMATQCTEVEAVWSMKGLIRAFRVLDSDVRRIRHHLDAAANVQPGTTPPPPLTLDTHKVVGAALTEWLSINRSTNEVLAKAIRADIESKLKAESAAVSRACALVQASLSDTVRRDIAAANLEKCAHCIISKLRGKYCSEEQKHATAISVYQRLHAFKFRPHASLDANLQAFDKLRTAVEKLEGHPLSDSHLASALLAALPSCIMQDYYMWRGPKPSIPYQDMRRLLEQHWPDLTLKYPSILGPAPTALAVPVHGSAPATATTRSSALALPAFRDGASQREGYGQAAAAPWGAQGQDPMADWCGYCLSSGSHSTYTCTKLSRAFHQNAVRQDFVFPPGWAAIPPGELPPSGGGRRTQGGPSGHRGGKRHGKGGGRGGGTGTPFLNTIRQGYASSGPPGHATSGRSGYASMGQGGHSGYASFNHGDYRDDQRGRSPFRQSASRYRSRSGDRYRDYREDRGYYRDDRAPYRDDRGYYRDDRAPYRDDRGSYRDDRGPYRPDSGTNQDDRHYRSRSHSMYDDRRHRSRSRSAPPVDQGYAQQASTPQRSQSRSASRGSTRTLPTATNFKSSAVAQSDSRSLASTMTH